MRISARSSSSRTCSGGIGARLERKDGSRSILTNAHPSLNYSSARGGIAHLRFCRQRDGAHEFEPQSLRHRANEDTAARGWRRSYSLNPDRLIGLSSVEHHRQGRDAGKVGLITFRLGGDYLVARRS